MLTRESLENEFKEWDREHFGGKLALGTTVAPLDEATCRKLAPDADASLEEWPYGFTSKDGSQIFVNPTGDHEWRSTLLHEMVHAYEKRFGHDGAPPAEAEHAARVWGSTPFYEKHSAAFFAILFRVIRERGGDPVRDFEKYFG